MESATQLVGLISVPILILAVWSMITIIVIKSRLERQTFVLEMILAAIESSRPAPTKENKSKERLDPQIAAMVTSGGLSVAGIALKTGMLESQIEAQVISLFQAGRITREQCERAIRRSLTKADIG
jgi:hypothetical protein